MQVSATMPGDASCKIQWHARHVFHAQAIEEGAHTACQGLYTVKTIMHSIHDSIDHGTGDI